MPKRKCSFNKDLETKYAFIKKTISDSDVRCEICGTAFSIAHGGSHDITKHLQSSKHKSAESSASTSKVLSSFFKSTTPTSIDLEIAASEGAWAYHTVKENQTFRSSDCTSKLIQVCFKPKFRCARTKCESIITKVFAPFSQQRLKMQLGKSHCISVSTDASNHGNIKVFPIIVQFYDPYIGIEVKLLDVQSQPGETSDIVVKYLCEVLVKNDISSKVIGFCGDNTNSNFGGAARKGINNTFRKLNTFLGREVIGIGCGAHIIHNAIQSACDCLPIEVESVIVKVYSYFYIYTVRVEELKEFCEFVSIEYKQMLGYSKTRWLALMPAVKRMIDMYPGLKSYFLSQKKCPVLLEHFFEDPLSEVWLNFIFTQASTFHKVVLKIEGDQTSAIEVMEAISELKGNLSDKLSQRFLPHKLRMMAKSLEEEGLTKRKNIEDIAVAFYQTAKEYLEQWSCHFEDINHFQWATLKNVPKWCDIEKSCDYVASRGFFDNEEDTKLFDDFSCLTKYATAEKITVWNDAAVPTDKRWTEIFIHFKKNHIRHSQLSLVVQFILSLPGTNAPVERIFSQMNKLWTSEKSHLNIDTLKALLMTKFNFSENCVEMYTFLKSSPQLIREIVSSEKYHSK